MSLWELKTLIHRFSTFMTDITSSLSKEETFFHLEGCYEEHRKLKHRNRDLS